MAKYGARVAGKRHKDAPSHGFRVRQKIDTAQILDAAPGPFKKIAAAHEDRQTLRAADRDVRRLGLKRNSVPRGASSPREVVIETMTTGASWPWNLSTVPTLVPIGQSLAKCIHLHVVGRDDKDIVKGEGVEKLSIASVYLLLNETIEHIGDDLGLLEIALGATFVREVEEDHPGRMQGSMRASGRRTRWRSAACGREARRPS